MGKPQSGAEKQRLFRQRQADKGLVLVREWVPQDSRERIRKYAEKLRTGR